ncbi:MAG: hypothetical protein Q8N51_00680 [Gammaproteobacteria bacterium]|nr:hypothetical protein [Gammaproteobacteria bacterium]
MRTRRSPRNQEILWRALGGPTQPLVIVDVIAAAEHDLALPFLSSRTRRMLERDLAKAKRGSSRP